MKPDLMEFLVNLRDDAMGLEQYDRIMVGEIIDAIAELKADNERLRAVYEAAKRHVAHDSDSDFADIKRDEDALIATLKGDE